MLRVRSREYKLMLDNRLFVDRKRAADDLWSEVQAVAGRLADIIGGEVAARRVVQVVRAQEKTRERSTSRQPLGASFASEQKSWARLARQSSLPWGVS